MNQLGPTSESAGVIQRPAQYDRRSDALVAPPIGSIPLGGISDIEHLPFEYIIPSGEPNSSNNTSKGPMERSRFERLPAKLLGTLAITAGILAGMLHYHADVEATEHIKPATTRIVEIDIVETTDTFIASLPSEADIPSPDTLSPIQDTPFAPLNDLEATWVNEMLEGQPNLSFAGAYSSTYGIDFNIYTSSVDDAGKEYDLHPQVLEFLMGQFKEHMPNAPENDSKQAILDEFERLASGGRKVVNIVYEMGPSASCLREQDWVFVADALGQCGALGVQNHISNDPQVATVIKVGDHTNVRVDDNYTAPYEEYMTNHKNPNYAGARTLTLGHELGHALSISPKYDDRYRGTYDHVNFQWLLGRADLWPAYEIADTTHPPRRIITQVYELTDRGSLPPLITER